MNFAARDDPNRCPSRVVKHGRTQAWCRYPAGHEAQGQARHHNGSRHWTDASPGVQRTPVRP